MAVTLLPQQRPSYDDIRLASEQALQGVTQCFPGAAWEARTSAVPAPGALLLAHTRSLLKGGGQNAQGQA